jgi:regulatory protein YycI of two-component signal transduction system YycFG
MTNISRRSITITAFFLLTFVTALLLLQHRSTAAGVARVHYRVLESLPSDNAKLEAQLNEYGQTGWELVLVDIGNVTKPAPRFIFKRMELP